MKIMSVITICLGLLFSIFLVDLTPSASEGLSPEEVVKRYVELSEAGKFEEIKMLVAAVPKAYEDADYEDFCRRTRELRESADKPRDPDVSGNPTASVPASGEDPNPTVDVLIDEPELIRSKGDYFKKVVGVVIHGNEGKVVAEIGNRNSEGFRVQREFFLLKTSKGWKIFRAAPYVSKDHPYATSWKKSC